MQVLRTLFARLSTAKTPAAPATQPVVLTPEQLSSVSGGLPRVGPCDASTGTEPLLPRVG